MKILSKVKINVNKAKKAAWYQLEKVNLARIMVKQNAKNLEYQDQILAELRGIRKKLDNKECN